MTVADPEIVGGVCGRSRAAEGREGWSVHGQESGEGAPHNLFSILDLKMASFGALWVPVGDASPSPLDPPLLYERVSATMRSLIRL